MLCTPARVINVSKAKGYRLCVSAGRLARRHWLKHGEYSRECLWRHSALQAAVALSFTRWGCKTRRNGVGGMVAQGAPTCWAMADLGVTTTGKREKIRIADMEAEICLGGRIIRVDLSIEEIVSSPA